MASVVMLIGGWVAVFVAGWVVIIIGALLSRREKEKIEYKA